MAFGVEVGRMMFGKLGGFLVMGVAALLSFFSLTPTALASSNMAPSGWDVQINGYTRGPNFTDWTLTLPAGYDHVKWYLYTSTTDTTPYYTHESGVLTPDSNGEVSTTLYDMQGGGNVTYIKATAVDDVGDETALPTNYFVLQLDVAVYLDGISSDVLSQLQTAWTQFEDSTPVGQIQQAGTDLDNAVTGITGYSASGSGDLSFSVPIITGKYGTVNATLFSSDQLAKLTWLSEVQTAIEAMMWITFVLWMIARFTPLFKV